MLSVSKTNLLAVCMFFAGGLQAMETKQAVAGATESKKRSEHPTESDQPRKKLKTETGSVATATAESKEQAAQLSEQEQQLLAAAAKGGKEGLAEIETLVKKYGVFDSWKPELGGINLDVQDANGNTPLMLAAQHEHPEIVKYLIEKLAERGIQNNDGRTALMFAANATSDKAVSMVKDLMGSWSNGIEIKDKQGHTAIFHAVRRNNLNVLKFLQEDEIINFRELINQQDNHGLTPLMLAAEDGYIDIVKFLLSAGADAELKDRSKLTALDRAKRVGQDNIVKILATDLGRNFEKAILNNDKNEIRSLLDRGALAVNGKNLLSFLIRSRFYEFVADFIKAGAPLNFSDEYGYTALMNAADQGVMDVVQQLLEAGADATKTNSSGRTAALIARKHWKKDLAELLEEAEKKQLPQNQLGSVAPYFAKAVPCMAISSLIVDTKGRPLQ